ncbi:anaphase-promoting complex subunit 10 family protein [Edaphobacter bradus]|uniref:hypothetical protein n=1 Tax=Edaphobacter bradus TaxID=2259016 RepID=UPI0021DFAED8|nr:hypothetical protein [Edaphobacter bradus]
MLGAGVSTGVTVRKRLLEVKDDASVAAGGDWLDLEKIAQVELTSEDAAFPIEHALGKTVTTGWRAAGTGPQVIRVLFDKPQAVRRIQVHFVDRVAERTQEFAVFAQTGDALREVKRQQWNFSPHGATEELEDYKVELDGVTALELRIDPDRSHDPKLGQHVASLQRLRLA